MTAPKQKIQVAGIVFDLSCVEEIGPIQYSRGEALFRVHIKGREEPMILADCRSAVREWHSNLRHHWNLYREWKSDTGKQNRREYIEKLEHTIRLPSGSRVDLRHITAISAITRGAPGYNDWFYICTSVGEPQHVTGSNSIEIKQIHATLTSAWLRIRKEEMEHTDDYVEVKSATPAWREVLEAQGFVSIESEEWREYTFPGGLGAIQIENPSYLKVSESGGHRIYSEKADRSYYIAPGWVVIEWKTREGFPKFVL